jgi:hypothetical protein
MPTAREILLQQVLDLAEWCGWRCYHQRPARTLHGGWKTALMGSPGFPDLTMVRPPRLIMAEIKSPGDKPTADQQAWLDELVGVPGIEAYCWWPKDWDQIVTILQRETTR